MDEWIPNRQVAKRCGNVTTRTIFRWVLQPELNFPQPAVIGGRRYFSKDAIEAWCAATGPTPVMISRSGRRPCSKMPSSWIRQKLGELLRRYVQ
jgi:predicted DNA-binding transcriptional regulator AlpA